MLRRKILSLSDLSLFESETIFHYFRKKKVNYCYGFMPSDFQLICGSVVAENCWLLASTETPGELPVLL